MRRGSNGPRVGSYNRSVVLDTIREADGISRVELAARTGLTPQTVSNIVRRLLSDRLVEETGQVQGDLGKPRTILRVNTAVSLAVGVHLDPVAVTGVVVDLAGRVVAGATRRTRSAGRPATVVNHIARVVEDALAQADVPRSAVLGVGLASPGALDAATGEVIGPPNLPGWERVALRDKVAERVSLPVTLDNDATAAAMGERWVGGAQRAGSFAFVYLGTGVGAGLVLADQLFRGASGNAGEFGHATLVRGGRECHCGSRGCLEPYVAPYGLREELVSDPDGAFWRDRASIDWGDLLAARRRGDRAAARALEGAADCLADGVVGLVNLLDLPRVVIGGRGLGPLAGEFSLVVERAVNARTLARRARHVEVVPSLVGDQVSAIGAASMVLHRSYAPHLSVLLADVSGA